MALDLVARMWACKAGRRESGLAELDREVWASGLVTCFWACKAGPYMCGPESKVHAGRGSRVAGRVDTRVARWVGLGV